MRLISDVKAKEACINAVIFDATHKRWYLSFLDDDGRILIKSIDDVTLPQPYQEGDKHETD